MAKINLTLDIDDGKIMGIARVEIKNEISKMIKGNILEKVKGRTVKIDGLIESAIREEVRGVIQNDAEIKKQIKDKIKEINSNEIITFFNKEEISKRIDLSIDQSINILMKSKSK